MSDPLSSTESEGNGEEDEIGGRGKEETKEVGYRISVELEEYITELGNKAGLPSSGEIKANILEAKAYEVTTMFNHIKEYVRFSRRLSDFFTYFDGVDSYQQISIGNEVKKSKTSKVAKNPAGALNNLSSGPNLSTSNACRVCLILGLAGGIREGVYHNNPQDIRNEILKEADGISDIVDQKNHMMEYNIERCFVVNRDKSVGELKSYPGKFNDIRNFYENHKNRKAFDKIDDDVLSAMEETFERTEKEIKETWG